MKQVFGQGEVAYTNACVLNETEIRSRDTRELLHNKKADKDVPPMKRDAALEIKRTSQRGTCKKHITKHNTA